jgi:hypothetical protein
MVKHRHNRRGLIDRCFLQRICATTNSPYAGAFFELVDLRVIWRMAQWWRRMGRLSNRARLPGALGRHRVSTLHGGRAKWQNYFMA